MHFIYLRTTWLALIQFYKFAAPKVETGGANPMIYSVKRLSKLIVWDAATGRDDWHAAGHRAVDFALVRAFADFEKALVAPTAAPRVDHQPVFHAALDAPSDQFHRVSAQLRRVFGPLVNA